jgi:hypothetical protein
MTDNTTATLNPATGAAATLTPSEMLAEASKVFQLALAPRVESGGTDEAKPTLPAAPTPTTEAKGAYVPEPEHEIPETVDDTLVKILTWPRKHNSPEERDFRQWLMDTIKDMGYHLRDHEVDAFSVTVPMPPTLGKAVDYSTTLFSCHIDTVDPVMTDPKMRKTLDYDANFGIISLAKGSHGGCLGADDGAGIWIMLKMLKADVPGTYLFHRGEECGGISAKAIAGKEQVWLSKFEAAVAFDRHRTSEIIITQGGSTCASEKFGGRLADALNARGLDYRTSHGGVYTDTKEYRNIIAECINVGVGYEGQHHTHETLDYPHLVALADACIDLNWDALPIERDPKAKPVTTSQSNWAGGWDDEDDGWKSPFPKTTAGTGKPASTPPAPKNLPVKLPTMAEEAAIMSGEELLSMAHDYPEDMYKAVIELLRENARLKADVNQLTLLLGVDS